MNSMKIIELVTLRLFIFFSLVVSLEHLHSSSIDKRTTSFEVKISLISSIAELYFFIDNIANILAMHQEKTAIKVSTLIFMKIDL